MQWDDFQFCLLSGPDDSGGGQDGGRGQDGGGVTVNTVSVYS